MNKHTVENIHAAIKDINEGHVSDQALIAVLELRDNHSLKIEDKTYSLRDMTYTMGDALQYAYARWGGEWLANDTRNHKCVSTNTSNSVPKRPETKYPLPSKLIVLNLAEDLKAMVNLVNGIDEFDAHDLIASANIMLETIDTAYTMRDKIESLQRQIVILKEAVNKKVINHEIR